MQQHSSTRRRVAFALIVTALVAGCSDSDDDGTNFDGFVLGLIDDTSDTAEPVSLEGRNFAFNENPAAFDTLFQ
jgi:hypothetical protein